MKRIAGVIILLFMLLGSTAYAAKSLVVMPLGGLTHAVLVQDGQNAVVVGAANAQEVKNVLDEMGIRVLEAVVSVCDEQEHAGEIDQLAADYNCPALTENQNFDLGKTAVSWDNSVLVVERGDDRYLLGAKNTEVGAIAYGCDGKLISYTGATNEAQVNVRAQTNTKSARVGKLARGEQISVLDTQINDDGELWYQVRLEDGTEGYIRSDLIGAAELPIQKASYAQAGASGSNSSSSGSSGSYEIAPSTNGEYIGNKNTKKFHKPSCGSLPAAKNQVYFSSRDKAISSGYVPCKKCNP